MLSISLQWATSCMDHSVPMPLSMTQRLPTLARRSLIWYTARMVTRRGSSMHKGMEFTISLFNGGLGRGFSQDFRIGCPALYKKNMKISLRASKISNRVSKRHLVTPLAKAYLPIVYILTPKRRIFFFFHVSLFLQKSVCSNVPVFT